MSATLVVLLILALFVGLYFYVANDLADLIARDRLLDELWCEVSEREPQEESPVIADASAFPSAFIGRPSRSLTSTSVGASVGPLASSLEQLTAGPAVRAGGPYDWKSEGFVA